jgi:hypothetical protein
LGDYIARLKRAGFERVEVDEHPEAVRKMVEASGMALPAGIERILSVNITAFAGPQDRGECTISGVSSKE